MIYPPVRAYLLISHGTSTRFIVWTVDDANLTSDQIVKWLEYHNRGTVIAIALNLDTPIEV